MQIATGALGSILPKLANLLYGEYKLQKGVRRNIKLLNKELQATHAAISVFSDVPPEQLPDLVKIWAQDARELSYDMEDVIDMFLVRVQGPNPPSRRSAKKFIRKLFFLCKRHQIGKEIKDIKERVIELAARRDRCKVEGKFKDNQLPVAATVDPRIKTLYSEATNLVGIYEAKQEILMVLHQESIVSIVGFGGLGKTTLAKAVYDDIKLQFRCYAFVTVSRNPDMKKFLKDMLYELNKRQFGSIHNSLLDERQLMDISRWFLSDKRYIIIIDDIWDISHWDLIIKNALPNNNLGWRIITTTRNGPVATHIGHPYHMRPISPYNSRVLLLRRIFGNKDSTLDEELTKVSERILNKCAGVPLAIITIASLLASKGRNKKEWEEVCNSIGNGIENSLDVKNMRKILSYSYYDMPSHLRTCLLYLSIFPEDCMILKDRLIWLWIAEGFVQPDIQWKKSHFELGETYFNELINRSMIEPLDILGLGEIDRCRVHDMVLELIHSLSSEENFVYIISNMDQKPPSTVVRRLSLQHGGTQHVVTQINQSKPLIRSVVVFPSALGQMLTLKNFKVLRVLDLSCCDLSQVHSLEYLGSLFHLRYLNLNSTKIKRVPEAIGNLQFLEMLDICNYEISDLPFLVGQLTHLLRLYVYWGTELVSKWIGSLSCLTELKFLHLSDNSLNVIHALGLLTELRLLHVMVNTNKWTDKVVESLYKLRKIQYLHVDRTLADECKMNVLDDWVLTPQLRSFRIVPVLGFSRLPAWLNNPSQFEDLYCLYISVRELGQGDLEILGRLPALYSLSLEGDHEDPGIVGRRFVVGASLFSRLDSFYFTGYLGHVMFQLGAMPKVKVLHFDFYLPGAREINGGFNCGLGNLRSLREMSIRIVQGDASDHEVQEAKAALEHAAEIHPGQPEIYFD